RSPRQPPRLTVQAGAARRAGTARQEAVRSRGRRMAAEICALAATRRATRSSEPRPALDRRPPAFHPPGCWGEFAGRPLALPLRVCVAQRRRDARCGGWVHGRVWVRDERAVGLVHALVAVDVGERELALAGFGAVLDHADHGVGGVLRAAFG